MLVNVDEQYAYLGTTGRVTGAEHEIEIWFASDGTTVWLISGGQPSRIGFAICWPTLVRA